MRRLALIALVGAAALTSGCISLFPKSDPAQLYRFELPTNPAPAAAPAARIGVVQTPIGFDRAAQGDAILTMNGGEAAYIAGARWVSPASVLFGDAVEEAFANSSVQLLARGQVGQTNHTLRLDVRRFEADYADPKGAPTVRIEIDATLARNDTRAVLAQRRFTASEPAAENRVGAIVPAFNAGLGRVLPQLVAWTGEVANADARTTPAR